MKRFFARLWHGLTRPWLRRSLIALLCLPFVLVLLVLGALAVPFTRRPIVAFALELTNESLDGMRIELDSADRLDLWGIDLSGARLFDKKKREMVSVKKARVRIAPLSLLTGTLSLTEAEVAGTRIHLYPSDEKEEEEEEEEDSEPSSFQILAHQLSVKDLTFDMDLSGKALHAVLHELSAHGAYGPKTRAAVEKLSVEADLDGQHAAALHSEYAIWDEKKGGKAALSGDLLDATLRIVAAVPAITDDTRWPVRRAELHLTGLRNEGIARVGYGDAAQLRVPVDLHVHAATSGAQAEVLSGDLALHAGQARLALKARATPSTYAADVSLPPADLAAISGILPAMRAGLHLSAEARHDVTPMQVTAKWNSVSLDGRAVPSGSLSAVLPLPVVKLESLSLAGLEQALSLSGSYDTSNNAADVALATHELNLSSFGGLLPEGSQGALNGSLNAHYAPNKLSGQGALSLRYFRMSDAGIDNASLGLDLTGTVSEPRGRIKLEAHQITSGETKIARVAVDANAGLRDIDGSVQMEGQDRVLSLVLTGKRGDDGTLTFNGGGKGRIKDKHVGLKLKDVQIAKDRYSVEELTAFSGRERLYLSGSFSGGENIDVALQIAKLDLAPLTRLFLADEITGIVDLTARAGGTISVPVAQAALKVHALHSSKTPRAPAVDLATKLQLDLAKHKASVALEAHSQDHRVELALNAEAMLARVKALAQAFERAKLKLDLKGHTDIPFLAQFAEAQLGALDGTVSADVSISGGMDEAEMYAKFASEVVPREERGKVASDRVDLDIVLKPAQLNVDLIVQDKFGKAIDLTSEAKLPAGGPNVLIAKSSTLIHSPVTLKLFVNERRLDKLQGSLGMLANTYGVALPVRAKAQVDLASTGDAITGKVMARAHLWGEGLDDSCGEEAEGDVAIDATLAGDKVLAQVTAQPSGGGKAQISLESQLLVNSLLDGSAFGWGPATLTARGDALALHTLPTLCMLPESRTSFRLDAKNLGKAPLESVLSLDVKEIPTSEGAVGMHVDVRSAPDAILANGTFSLDDKDKGRFSAKVPLLYADSPFPKVPLDKPFQAGLDLPDFPLAGLTSFTDAVGSAGGRIRANLQAKGTLAAPDPSGVIELKDASFSIASLAQPFSDVDARFELAPDKLVIRKLSARDRSGKLSLVGYARYNPTRGGEAEVHMSADKFPIRQQGSIIGELSTRAVIEGKVDAQQKMQLTLQLKEGRIWLTGEGGHQVQELDEHPDVRFDTDQVHKITQSEPKPAANELTLSLLHIKSDKDLWLMHDDFAVQVGVDMKLTNEEGRFEMGGEATITRGDLTLLGKPFRIEKGSVRFTGDVPPDPELDLKAKHTTPTGKVLLVQVTGRASAPEIGFSGAANNAGEAAQLLSGIGQSGAESKAKNEAANFAASLTAGLLAVSARRRFGDWVPMLAMESDESGAPSGARAGFDASRLIPKFMRGFARGMFVEGVVGTRSDTQQRGVGVGVRVEVALPRDFMTSMGYGPGTVWSTDVYWSP